LPVETAWLDASEEHRWESFAPTHPLSTIFQTLKWRAVLHSAFPHLHGRPLVVRDNVTRQIVAGTMIYSVRSWLLGSRIVSVPLASYVDPLATEASHLMNLTGFIATLTGTEPYQTAELRLLKTGIQDGVGGATESRDFKHYYLNLTEGPDKLYSKFSRTAIRQLIQRADRNSVTIHSGASQRSERQAFYGLYANTRRRLALPVLPWRFFDALHCHLPAQNLSLLTARLHGDTVGASMALVFDGVYLLEWLGDSRRGRAVGVNQKLYWHAIQDATARGCHTFSFGRTRTTHVGLLAFKRRWGAIEEDVRTLVWGRPARSQVGRRAANDITRRIAKGILKSTPKPVYLALSDFCYRHLG
jgi:hypothetical protein